MVSSWGRWVMKPIGLGIMRLEILPDQIDVRLKPHAHEAIPALAGMLK